MAGCGLQQLGSDVTPGHLSEVKGRMDGRGGAHSTVTDSDVFRGGLDGEANQRPPSFL